MSVGGVDPKSQGTPPVPVARSRFEARPAHKISYKLTKPKASKVKHLTRSELFGIGLSVVLSFTIVTTVILVGMYIVPVVLRFISEIMIDVLDGARSHSEPTLQSQTSTAYSRYVTTRTDITCGLFTSQFEDKDTVLFETPATKLVTQNSMASLGDTPWQSETITMQPIDTDRTCAAETCKVTSARPLSMPIKDFMSGQFSLNTDMEAANFWVSEDIGTMSPTQIETLQKPLIPATSGTLEACPILSSPLGDFKPSIFTLARNESHLSGGAFHAHKRSVSLLLHGRKRWILFPPDQVTTVLLGFDTIIFVESFTS
jgi:hypothetical protein